MCTRRRCEFWLALGVALLAAAEIGIAQPPGGGGPGGSGRGGFGSRFGGGGRGGFDPNNLFFQMANPEFRKQLALTEEQQEQYDDFAQEMGEAMRAMFAPGAERPSEEEMAKRRADNEQRLLGILTEDQKKLWETRKAELAQNNPGPMFGGPPGAPPGPPPSAEPVRRGAIPNLTPGEGESAVVSFAVPGLESAHGPGNEPLMSFNFRYAPWADVLSLFAEIAGLTADLNDTPTGTFNYYDNHQYTVTEALDVLNGYLLPKGYVLVRRDRFLVCLNIDDGIPPNLIPIVTIDELPHRGKNELVSIVLPIETVDADDIDGEISQLVGPQGKVTALRNTNSLVVMDVAANVKRVVDLLKSSTALGRGDTAFKSIALKHISAADAERTIRRLFGLNPMTTISTAQQPTFPSFGGPFGGFGGFSGGFGGPPGFGGFDRSRDDRGGDSRDSRSSSSSRSPTSSSQTRSPYADKIWITADTRTNSLLVTASPELLRVVESAVQSLDTADGDDTIDSGPMLLKVYNVTGNATQVALTLSMMLPGLGITDNPSAGQLYIQATADEHKEVDRLLQDLSGSGSNSVAVIPLYRLDPVSATNTLRNLFANEGTRAPSIEADADGRRLMVRGTPDQVSQVRALLADLGETGENPRGQPTGRGTMRTFSLGGRDAADFLPLLRQSWESSAPNPIRIVVPSASNPIRDLRVPSESPLPDSVLPSTSSRREDLRSSHETPASTKKVSFRTALLQEASPEFVDEEVPNADGDAGDFNGFLKSFLEPAPAEGNGPAESTAMNDDQAPVGITVVGDQLVMTSSDPAVLDQLETLLAELATLMPAKTKWTVFYLRSSDATEAAQMLERLFPQSSVTTSTAQTDGILGSLAGGLSTIGRGMMNVSGLNTLGSQSLRIVTDTRANALFVTGPSSMIAEVEQMLRLLDATELPTSLRDRVPRSIPVQYADVDEVAAIVQNLFQEEMTPAGGDQNGRQQGGNRGGGGSFNPLAMMMGAAQGGGRGQEVQLTLGVDRQTSHLIVSCNDNLFRQVEEVVMDLDERARAAKPVVRVMPLASADPVVLSTTLSSLMPKVTISATRAARTQPNQPGGQPGRSNGSNGNSGGTNDAPNPEFFRQMMEERFRSQTGGNSGRSDGDRSSSGRSFGGFGSRGGDSGGFGGFGNRGAEGGFPRGPR